MRTQAQWASRSFFRITALSLSVLVLCSACNFKQNKTTLAATPSVAETNGKRFPRNASRFELRPLTDSTVSFDASDSPWVKSGMVGIAVDPARGDALVARLRIDGDSGSETIAFVTGQTTRVAQGHVILLVEPQSAWWSQKNFWFGTLAGAGVAGLTAILVR